ncbi:MAG: DUF6666 family protein [Planctomycetota bacterium]
MITSSQFDARGLSRRIVGRLLVWGCIVAALPALISQTGAIATAGGPVKAAGRIDLSDAKPVRATAHQSQVGYVTPQASPRASQVQTTSHLGHVFEPACGCETVCDCPGVFEPACGLEPVCGTEVLLEPGCGLEICETSGCDSMDPNCGCNVCAGGTQGFLDGLFPRLEVRWKRYDFFAGVSSFTGPMNFANVSGTGTDLDGAGSFGFYEGFNRGFSLGLFGSDLAYQSGVRFTQSNLSGAGFTDESRGQVFLTSGLFRRVDYGLQYGVVLDYQYEDWYFRSDMIQLRGELSWVTRAQDVWGFKFAAGVDDDTALTSVTDDAGQVVQNTIVLEPLTQYRIFHRQTLAGCGLFEGFVGWTDNDDGLLGMELDLPIHPNLMWNTSATYLIPSEGTAQAGHTEESWNLGIGLTFRPGGVRGGSRYSRPLFKVADNGSFLVDRR